MRSSSAAPPSRVCDPADSEDSAVVSIQDCRQTLRDYFMLAINESDLTATTAAVQAAETSCSYDCETKR